MQNNDPTVVGGDDPSAVTLAPSPVPISPDAMLSRGDALGRYVVLDRLGAGGMGVVYSAYDPQLDRKIALKLVRNPRATVDSEGPSRLLREAQAMAKLAHPNVIAVHDVGVVAGRVFIAMEFIEGETLGAWLERERSWDETLDVFVGAAEGLVAAHEVGIVHRDFKPDNVLIGRDGRVRVMDFGLARADESELVRETPNDPEPGGTTLTMTGAIMGTPAYMAPEQHVGLRADARADQFGFCVALYEGLYGKRPFDPGGNRHSLALAVLEGRIEPPPKPTEVPSWLHAIVVRGLATDPEQRFASMADLLGAITAGRDPESKRPSSRLVLGLALAFGIGGSIGVAAFWGSTGVAAPCEATDAEINQAWGPDQREAVHAAFTDADLSERARTSVIDALDTYSSEWTTMRLESCEATRVSGSQSDELMDLRTQCLDRRRAELGALVHLLASGKPAALAKAGKSVENLVPVSVCADVEQLRTRVALPEDPSVRAAVERGEAVLADAHAHFEAGLYAEVVALLDTVEPEALGHAPLAAAVGELRGRTLHERGEYVAAEQTLVGAALDAARGRDDRLLVEIYIDLANLVGIELGQPAEGARIDAMTQVVLARIGGAPDLDRRRRLIRASIARTAGDPDVAQAQLETLRDELRGTGDDDTELGDRVERMLAGLLANRGRYDEASELLTRSISTLERRLGDDHPSLVVPLTNLSAMYAQRGDMAAAATTHERVLALAESRLGSNHPDTAVIYESIGVRDYHLRKFADARSYLERAVDSYAVNYDAGHPSLVRARGNLSAVLIELGEYELAEKVLIECRDALVERFGRDHDYLVFLLNNLAELYTKVGRHPEAREAIRWARTNAEATFGPNHRTAECYVIEGVVELAAGDSAAAIVAFEAALAIYAKIEATPDIVARAETGLARALLPLPERRAEAAELLLSAVAHARVAGDSGTAVLADAQLLALEAGLTVPGD